MAGHKMKKFLRPIYENIIDEETTIKTVLELMKKKSIDCVLILKDK